MVKGDKGPGLADDKKARVVKGDKGPGLADSQREDAAYKVLLSLTLYAVAHDPGKPCWLTAYSCKGHVT